LGIHSDSLLPQSETFEHLLDHLAFVDKGHDLHLALAVGADHGIRLPDPFDEIPPFLGRNAAGLAPKSLKDRIDISIAEKT
jgi:hypothetical protein